MSREADPVDGRPVIEVEPLGDGPVLESEPVLQTAPGDDASYVGVVTRAVSWMLDAVVINAVAIAVGLGAQLFFSIFPISSGFSSALKPIAASVYLVWAAVYFVLFWSWTGQTVGASVMQIRLVTDRGPVKPARAVVRWVGMNLAMLPLFAGFAPILVGRRGFPDWLARTQVIREPQPWPQVRRRTQSPASRDDRRDRAKAISPAAESNGSPLGRDP